MRLTIAAQLGIGFGAVLLLSLGLALFQLSNFRDTISYIESVSRRDAEAYDRAIAIAKGRPQLVSMREDALTAAALAAQRQAKPPPDQSARYAAESDRITAEMADFQRFADNLSRTGLSSERRRAWTEIAGIAANMVEAETQIRQRVDAEFALLRQGRIDEAAAEVAAVAPLHKRLDDDLKRIQATLRQAFEVSRTDVAVAYRQAENAALGAIALALLAGALAAWLMGRRIVGRVQRYVAFARGVGEGDLTLRVPEDGRDELAVLGQHLNRMTDNLAAVARETHSSAETVNSTTAQIRAAAQEQAAAMAQQLSALEETTATLTQITHSGAQIATRSRAVESNAHAAVGASESGLKAVEDTGQAMDAIREQVGTVAETIVRLSERTQAIGEIILTVNTIAERSHLLALNAAIEAAAAGEHGRTFSVVATEIKKLADQAREATAQVRSNLGEIQHGINTSVMLTEEAAKRVAAGKRQTEAADRTIRELADAIQDSVQAFQQTVAATNQHQIGLEQAMQALTSIRQASSQTGAATRELESAAGALASMAQGLVGAVTRYRV